MKRLLQIVSGMLAVLACALAWRIVQVLRVAPPVFEEPAQVATAEPLPPAPHSSSPRGAAMDAIVEGNLFESDRGQSSTAAGGSGSGEPLPPPTNVVLNGIFVMEGQPMAIVSDSTAGNKQLTLRVGDSVSDYQVGEISDRRVTLLGHGGQQFSLDLDIKKGPQAAAPVAQARPQPAAARPQPATTTGQTAAQRAAAARAAAATRASTQSRARPAGGHAEGGEESNVGPDASQARMDALKRLREASQR